MQQLPERLVLCCRFSVQMRPVQLVRQQSRCSLATQQAACSVVATPLPVKEV